MNRKNLPTLFWGAVFALSFAGSAQGAVTPTPMDHWEIDPTPIVKDDGSYDYNVATDGLWSYAVQINGSALTVYKAQSYAGNDGDKATLDLSKPFFMGSEQYIVTSYDPCGSDAIGGHPDKKLNGGNFCLRNGLCHLLLPDTLLSIGKFCNYEKLESITPLFPASLNSLPTEKLFDNCTSLTGHLHIAGMESWTGSINDKKPKFDQLTFEGLVKTNGPSLWAKSAVTNVNILTDHPVAIGKEAFSEYTSLKTIRVGAKSAIASVGDNAFQKCMALERIDWEGHEPGYVFAPATSMGNCPFGDNNNKGGQKLTQPLVLTNLNWTTQGGYRVPNVDPSGGDPNGNTIYIPFQNTGFTEVLLIMKPDTGNPDGLPYGFWSRGSTALFKGMTGITNAVIRYPEVSYLSQHLFANCKNLQAVSFDAARVTKMGGNVFDGCTKLEMVLTPNVPRYDPSFAVSISTLTNVGNSAFRNCSSLKSASLGSLGAPLLLSGTTDENAGVFRNAGLEKVELAAQTLDLGVGSTYGLAFAYCDSLRRVDIAATQVVGLGAGTFAGCAALTDVYWTSPAPEKVGTNREVFGTNNSTNHVMRGQWPATPSGVIPCITWTDSKSGTWNVHSSQTVPLAAWTPVAGAGFVILGQ